MDQNVLALLLVKYAALAKQLFKSSFKKDRQLSCRVADPANYFLFF
jgi:hypothetical protein